MDPVTIFRLVLLGGIAVGAIMMSKGAMQWGATPKALTETPQLPSSVRNNSLFFVGAFLLIFSFLILSDSIAEGWVTTVRQSIESKLAGIGKGEKTAFQGDVKDYVELTPDGVRLIKDVSVEDAVVAISLDKGSKWLPLDTGRGRYPFGTATPPTEVWARFLGKDGRPDSPAVQLK